MVDRGRLDYEDALSFVDPRIRSSAPSEKTQLLEPGYEPGYWDVICQGGKGCFDHIGNRRFRICIDNNLETYTASKSKHQRSMVVTVIVDSINDSSTQEFGGFVRKDLATGRWYEVPDKVAREKVGHALRDAMKLRKKKLTRDNANNYNCKPAIELRNRAKRRRIGEEAPQNGASSFAIKVSSNMDKAEEKGSRHTRKESALPMHGGAKEMQANVASVETKLRSCESQDDWEKSLKECAEQFATSGGDVLGQLPGEETFYDCSNKSTEDIVSNKLGMSRLQNKAAACNAFEWNPPGLSSMDTEFQSYTKTFAPTPMDDSVCKPASKPKPDSKSPGCGSPADELAAYINHFGPAPIKSSKSAECAPAKVLDNSGGVLADSVKIMSGSPYLSMYPGQKAFFSPAPALPSGLTQLTIAQTLNGHLKSLPNETIHDVGSTPISPGLNTTSLACRVGIGRTGVSQVRKKTPTLIVD